MDILGYYLRWDPSWTYEVFDGNYVPVADPTVVSQPGFYNASLTTLGWMSVLRTTTTCRRARRRTWDRTSW